MQTNQTVNDQAFDAYILHAGRRSKVLASSRHDNSQHGDSPHSDSRYGGSNNNELGWEWATVVAAGMGLTAQFMGLRGLTYPSSIAQILAIVVMTVIRAVIRRRLERPPKSHETVAGYEFDHLATEIANKSNNAHKFHHVDQSAQKGKLPKNPFHWKGQASNTESFKRNRATAEIHLPRRGEKPTAFPHWANS